MSSWLLPLCACAAWAGLLARPAVAVVLPPGVALALAMVVLLASVLLLPRGGRGGGGSLVGGFLQPPTRPPAALGAVEPRTSSRPGRVVVVAIGLALGVFLLAAGWGSIRHDQVAHGVVAELSPGYVQVTGSLRTDAKAGDFGWSAQLGVSRISGDGRTFETRESVWVQGDGPPPEVTRGDVVSVAGRLGLADDPGFASYLDSRGIAGSLSIDHFERVGPSPNPLVRLADAVRGSLSTSLASLFGPREAGLVMGLALGDTSHLDEGMARDFKATGLSHLLAVSGGNVAMVLAPVMALALALRINPTVRFALGLATVVFFVVLTGGEPSVLRAGVMAGIGLSGVLMGERRNTWSVLAAAVLILLLLDPFLVSAVGFQLSVTATAGMVAFAGPLAAKLSFLPGPVAASMGTSVAAQLGVAPLLLSYFHWIPGVTVLANLLAFPVVGPVLLLGLAAAALSGFAPPLAALLAGLAQVLLAYMMWLADTMASAPVAAVTSPGGLVPLVAGSATVVALAVWIRTNWRPPRSVLLAGCVAMPVFVLGTALGSGPPGGLTAHFLNTGQGDSILVMSPAGATILIDGGPEPDIAATKLAALGVKRLDVVIATHPHADHVAGLPEVLARFPVGLVLEPGCSEDSPAYADFLQAVDDEGLEVRYPRTGDHIEVGDVDLAFLSPPSCYEGTHSDANNDSLVAMLSKGQDSILFPGDAEVEAQQQMLDAGAALDADVLKVPHHGGNTSQPEFLAASHAEVAVIQVGDPNDYGHPTDEVLATLDSAGMKVFRNDLDGDVTVTFSPEGVLVESATA